MLSVGSVVDCTNHTPSLSPIFKACLRAHLEAEESGASHGRPTRSVPCPKAIRTHIEYRRRNRQKIQHSNKNKPRMPQDQAPLYISYICRVLPLYTGLERTRLSVWHPSQRRRHRHCLLPRTCCMHACVDAHTHEEGPGA